jgi:hypothetical protein
MIGRLSTLCMTIAVATAPAVAALQAGGSPQACRLPFETIATRPDPAAACRFEGCFTNQDKKFEDLAKNSFCLDPSHATDLSDFTEFSALQKACITGCKPTGDRSKLRAMKPLGEGSIVRLAAFIKEAHTSDCEGGEAVNCDKTGFAVNDIHIPLVQKADETNECFSVTAEMSPHFRPAAWSQIDQKTPVKRLVRVTGPLFYDDSHEPCTFDPNDPSKVLTSPSPNRLSVWEIHPVYAIEVCSTESGADCKVGDQDNWLAYDEWVKKQGAVVADTGKVQREKCAKAKPVNKPCPGKVP